MDVNTFVLSLSFSLVLLVLSFFGRRSGWGLLGLFGVVVAIITALALLSDGNLTEFSGGSQVTLAAANTNFVSDFNTISVIPISVAFGEFVVTIRRMFRL